MNQLYNGFYWQDISICKSDNEKAMLAGGGGCGCGGGDGVWRDMRACIFEGGGWVVRNKSQLVIITVVPFCRLVFFQSSLKIHLNFERIYRERE